MDQLALAFVGNGRALPDDVAGLAGRLALIRRQTRTAWPGVEIQAEEFARYLGEKVADAAQLFSLRAGDLYRRRAGIPRRHGPAGASLIAAACRF